MAFYLAKTTSIRNRKIENVFYFDNGFLCNAFENKQIFSLKEDKVENYKALLEYVILNQIDAFEVALDTNLKEEELNKILELYYFFIEDKELSVGLLIIEESEALKNSKLFDKYGLSIRHVKVRKKEHVGGDRYGTFGVLFNVCDVTEKRSYKSSIKPIHNDIILEMSFHDLFLMYLRECGKDNVEVYKSGGITRQVFSKILSDENIKPKKETVICLIIGMELSYDDAVKLLLAAGYALSKSIMSDAVIMKYLKNEIYDLDLINSELAERECPELGWNPR